MTKQVIKRPVKKVAKVQPPAPAPRKEVVKELPIPEGLEQTFKDKAGKITKLINVISRDDVWEQKGRTFKATIISHEGVKKIADRAGISKDVDYTVLTQPTAYNNYQYTIQVKVKRIVHLNGEENSASEIGEANRNNLRSRGRANPANMAQKRAYDRAVLRLLDIKGILSEEELADEEPQNDMPEELTHDERKEIAPIINKLLLAKDNKDLILFASFMKEQKEKCKDNQLEYLRKLYTKRVGELTPKKF